MSDALLDPAATAALRDALSVFTAESVRTALGGDGSAALARGDPAGVERALREHADPKMATLVRLFLLGRPVRGADAAAALHPLPLDTAGRHGLLAVSAGSVRALYDVRPHAEDDDRAQQWWVVSDFGSDVRPGPLGTDHVLGVGPASVTLAQLIPRRTVERALDIGTGSGVQALHLSTHCGEVVATDVTHRALRCAATTAALSGQAWQLRQGSVGEIPRVLAPNGSAHLLANWLIVDGRPWEERVGGWLADGRCDAWVWQREVVEPAEYVALWLHDAGLTPATPEWAACYDAWLDWFAATGAAAVGMGFVSMWQTDSQPPIVVCEDVPQAIQQPAGEQIGDWIGRQRWLARTDDATLLASPLAVGAAVTLDRTDILHEMGWHTTARQLRQDAGLRWRVEVDDAIAAVVAGCTGALPLGTVLSVLAAAVQRPTEEVASAALPIVRDLLGRGFLLPPQDPAHQPVGQP